MRATTRRGRRLAPLGIAGAAAIAAIAAALPVITAPDAVAAEPIVVVNSTFEDGTVQGWTPRGDETVAVSTAAAHAGTASLLSDGRTRTWEGPVLDVLGTMEQGTRYTLSVWVRLAANETATQARLSVERRTAGVASYDQVVGDTNVTNGGWTQLTGSYTLATDVEFLSAYVETATGTPAFHIDDFTMSYVPATPIQTDLPSVKTVLADSFPIGAAISRPQIIGQHAQLLSKHFNSVTPGNALKWDATEPAEGAFRYTDADAMVDYAVANGMAVRGHTLVWHNQTPAWVFLDADGNAMTATEANKTLLLTRLENHIRAVMGRYAGKIFAWDVANEVIDENQSDGLRRSTWYTITGLDYLRTAFRVAREVDPRAKLFINDYNTNVTAKRDKLYDLVQQLKAEGVPIDGIGHQMHVNVDWPPAAETEAMITKFTPLGVEQQITEMDISIYVNNGESFPTPPADRLLKQGYRYRDLFDVYKRHASEITSVTLWGLADDETWLDTFPVTRNDAPLLFDEQLQAKPAYWGIVDPSKIGATASPTLSPTASPTAIPTASPTAGPSASPTAGPTAGPTGSASPIPPAQCLVTYKITGQWPGGFQGDVKVTTSTAVSGGWTLGWSFADGQQISQLWGGTVTQSGATVTVTNAAWNGTIVSGGSASLGFIAGWNGTNAAPARFTFNGNVCTII